MLAAVSLTFLLLNAGPVSPPAQAQLVGRQPVHFDVSGPVERLEMIVNTSRIITTEHNIPRLLVENEATQEDCDWAVLKGTGRVLRAVSGIRFVRDCLFGNASKSNATYHATGETANATMQKRQNANDAYRSTLKTILLL